MYMTVHASKFSTFEGQDVTQLSLIYVTILVLKFVELFSISYTINILAKYIRSEVAINWMHMEFRLTLDSVTFGCCTAKCADNSLLHSVRVANCATSDL